MPETSFWKDRFYFIVVSITFVLLFTVWVNYNFDSQVKEFLIGVFGAWLAMLGIRPKQDTQIQAEHIETASTESGDIKVAPGTKLD